MVEYLRFLLLLFLEFYSHLTQNIWAEVCGAQSLRIKETKRASWAFHRCWSGSKLITVYSDSITLRRIQVNGRHRGEVWRITGDLSSPGSSQSADVDKAEPMYGGGGGGGGQKKKSFGRWDVHLQRFVCYFKISLSFPFQHLPSSPAASSSSAPRVEHQWIIHQSNPEIYEIKSFVAL